MHYMSDISGSIQKPILPSFSPPDENRSKTEKKGFGVLGIAILVTVMVHGAAFLVIYFFGPEKVGHRISRPLEAILLTPPRIETPKLPPPPPRPKVIKVEKPEPKPLPPPIQPVVTPEPEVKNDEPSNPVAPAEEPPQPAAPPLPAPLVEEVVLPEYQAAYLHNMPPPYPPAAKRAKIEGIVRVRALISPAGLPQQVELARSSGSSVLDDAALKAVRGWTFVPARRGAEATAAWVEIPINFNLK